MSNTTGRVSVPPPFDLGTNDRKHRLGPDPDAARGHIAADDLARGAVVLVGHRPIFARLRASTTRAPMLASRMNDDQHERGAPGPGDGVGQRQVIRT